MPKSILESPPTSIFSITASINSDIFDIGSIPKLHDISIIGNILKFCEIQEKKQHCFIFGHDKKKVNGKCDINNNCDFSFRVKLLTECHWFAFGFCDKKQVINNEAEFNLNSTKNNGCFVIATNGLKWNCMEKNRFRFKILPKPENLNKKNTVVEVHLNPFERVIYFLIFDRKDRVIQVTMKEVELLHDQYYTPCFICLKNCEFQVQYNY